MTKTTRPLVLIILDGWGVSRKTGDNALAQAKTPFMDGLLTGYPSTVIKASGEAVGLPEGQMGNSEVGHLNIGAGRVVYQDLTRINKAIRDGSFYTNPVLLKAFERASVNDSRLHLIGLLSDGGVHSHIFQLQALLKLCREKKLMRVCLHVFLDGRDVPPRSAVAYVKQIEATIAELGVGEIATISGRYYGMDRDKRWERTKPAYDAIVYGKGRKAATAVEAVENSYAEGTDDEFVVPTVVEAFTRKHPHRQQLVSADCVVFFNFRPDRARQLSRALTADLMGEFDRGENPPFPYFVTLTEYDPNLKAEVAYPPEPMSNLLTDVLSGVGFKQLRIAETEKYAHVTFFFNGGEEEPRPLEDRILIPSPKVATYDLQPEMSAPGVTERVLEELDSGKYDVVIMNYANPDMVGHTGKTAAAVKAAETIDDCLRRVVERVTGSGGEVIITADHGNIEQMRDYESGEPHTAHTSNDVPLIYVSKRNVKLRSGGKLADIAPTMLEILGLEKPEEMTGGSLIEHKA